MDEIKRGALIVNFFGGPGGGKTTAGARLFVELKMRGIDAEMDMELARQMILMEHVSAIECQPYLFGVALYKLQQTCKNTEVVVMDSPLLLNPIYDKVQSPALRSLSIEWHNRFRNLNVFIERPSNAIHSMAGRIHDLHESVFLDQLIRDFLESESIPYLPVAADADSISQVADEVQRRVEAYRSLVEPDLFEQSA